MPLVRHLFFGDYGTRIHITEMQTQHSNQLN
jgi:hypothetical protein